MSQSTSGSPMPAAVQQRAWWGDRGVSTKILTAVAGAGVVAATIGVMGISALGTSADATQELYEGNLAGITAIDDMIVTVGETRKQLRDVLINPDPTESAALLAGMNDLHEQFMEQRAAYEATGATAEAQELLDEASASFDEYVQIAQTVVGPFAIASDNVNFYEANRTQAAPLAQATEDGLNEIAEAEDAEAAAAAADARDQYERQRTFVVALLVDGLGVAAGLGWFVARSIARGLGRVRTVAERLATGDLTRTAGLTTQDELGRMGAALDAAIAELRTVMTSVVTSADAVAASSEEISASSAQISASAEETSAQSGVVAGAAE